MTIRPCGRARLMDEKGEKMKEKLIFNDGSSAKFWTIETGRDSFSVTSGEIGTQGQVISKSFADEKECEKEALSLTGEKIKQGYRKSISKGLWEIIDSGYLASALSAMENSYFEPESEFIHKNRPIQTCYLYVSEWPDIFINCEQGDEDNQSLIEVDREEMEKKLSDLNKSKMEIEDEIIMGDYPEWAETCSSLGSGQLCDHLGAGQVEQYYDGPKMDFSKVPISKYDSFSEPEVARLKKLYSEGHWTLIQATFYYRLAARMEQALRRDPRYSIADDAVFSAFIHDSMLDSDEESMAPLYRVAKEYADKPIDEYLSLFGII
jgi:predicted DNA-binding WGR domain protein